MRLDPLPVSAAGYVAHPIVIFEIPIHGLAYSALKRFLRTPPQFALDLASVHGIAAGMPSTVFDERDKIPARRSSTPRHPLPNTPTLHPTPAVTVLTTPPTPT